MALSSQWECFGREAGENRDCSVPTLARGPWWAAWIQPVPLCEQCVVSRFALLLLQTMDIDGKIDGAIESMFLETFCWKYAANFVTDRVSFSPQLPTSIGSRASWLITSGFALVALPWCPAKCLLTEETDKYVCVSVCSGASFLQAVLMFFSRILQSSLLVSEDQQSCVIADVAGGTGRRRCLQSIPVRRRLSGAAVKVIAVTVMARWHSFVTHSTHIFPEGCDAYKTGMMIMAVLRGAEVNLQRSHACARWCVICHVCRARLAVTSSPFVCLVSSCLCWWGTAFSESVQHMALPPVLGVMRIIKIKTQCLLPIPPNSSAFQFFFFDCS